MKMALRKLSKKRRQLDKPRWTVVTCSLYFPEAIRYVKGAIKDCGAATAAHPPVSAWTLRYVIQQ